MAEVNCTPSPWTTVINESGMESTHYTYTTAGGAYASKVYKPRRPAMRSSGPALCLSEDSGVGLSANHIKTQ